MVNATVTYPPHRFAIMHDDKVRSINCLYRTEWCERCGTLKGEEFDLNTDLLCQHPTNTQYRPPDGTWDHDMPNCRALGVTSVGDLVVAASDAAKSLTIRNLGITGPLPEGKTTWPVAGLFEKEGVTRGKKEVARSPAFASLSARRAEVAHCWADCPDGTRRRVRVFIDPQELLDWALANLPHGARLTGGGHLAVVWTELEEVQ